MMCIFSALYEKGPASQAIKHKLSTIFFETVCVQMQKGQEKDKKRPQYIQLQQLYFNQQ